jgi:hypothetical protein
VPQVSKFGSGIVRICHHIYRLNSMLRHHFSPNGRTSCSKTQALRGC